MRILGVVGAMVWHSSTHDMVHVAHLLYLGSYLVRDILWLRVLTVGAGLSLLPYYFTCGPEPLWAAIGWNLLFAFVNVVQIAILAGERWPRWLEAAEQQLYDRVFSDLSIGGFRGLLKKGAWRDVGDGERIVEQGSAVESLMILTDGAMEVPVGDRVIAELDPGQCIGEMSFLSGDPAAADVVATKACRMVSWPQSTLRKLLDSNAILAFKLRAVLGRDVVTKLRTHTTGSGDRTASKAVP